mgnify:CR=1 FL=1|jgi:NADPH-dependent ferric siderophore reductase
MVNVDRVITKLWRIKDHPVTVQSIEYLNDYYLRIRFHAPDLVADLDVFPTAWFRLWAPRQEDTSQDTMRAYTFSAVDRAAGTFDADFVLHATGAATDWAKHAQPGQESLVALTPAQPKVPAGTSAYVLVGDLTALPAINTWIADIPADQAITAAIEDDHADRTGLPIATHPRLDLHWIEPAANEPKGTELAAWLRTLPTPQPGTYVWGAGERALVRAAKQHAKEAWGMPRGTYFTQYYWIEGKAGH